MKQSAVSFKRAERHCAPCRRLTLPSSGLAPAAQAWPSIHSGPSLRRLREPLMSNVRRRKQEQHSQVEGVVWFVTPARSHHLFTSHHRVSPRRVCAAWNRNRSWPRNPGHGQQRGREPCGGCPSFGGPLASSKAPRQVRPARSASFLARFEHIDGWKCNASLVRKVCVELGSVRAHCQL